MVLCSLPMHILQLPMIVESLTQNLNESKKTQQLGRVAQKAFSVTFTASEFHSVMLCPNLMTLTVCPKRKRLSLTQRIRTIKAIENLFSDGKKGS